MNVDDLVHELELEADVLRPLSHLTPTATKEFLLRLILKINRSCELPTGVSVEVTEDDSVVEVASTDGPPARLNKTQLMIDLVKQRGSIDKKELIAEAAKLCGDLSERGPSRMTKSRHSAITARPWHVSLSVAGLVQRSSCGSSRYKME